MNGVHEWGQFSRFNILSVVNGVSSRISTSSPSSASNVKMRELTPFTWDIRAVLDYP
jgi:hypothetical protein